MKISRMNIRNMFKISTLRFKPIANTQKERRKIKKDLENYSQDIKRKVLTARMLSISQILQRLFKFSTKEYVILS